jgi:hypothetical protein
VLLSGQLQKFFFEAGASRQFCDEAWTSTVATTQTLHKVATPAQRRPERAIRVEEWIPGAISQVRLKMLKMLVTRTESILPQKGKRVGRASTAEENGGKTRYRRLSDARVK